MNCGFSTEAKSMEELLPKIVHHASETHGIKEISSELRQKVMDAIKISH